jgi:hypothetical protein
MKLMKKDFLVLIGAFLLVMVALFVIIDWTDQNPPDLYTNVQPDSPSVTQMYIPVPHVWVPPNADDHDVTVHPIIVDR